MYLGVSKCQHSLHQVRQEKESANPNQAVKNRPGNSHLVDPLPRARPKKANTTVNQVAKNRPGNSHLVDPRDSDSDRTS